MKKTLAIVVLVAAGGLLGCAKNSDVSINFDATAFGQPFSAPSTFDMASPLGGQYGLIGVRFSGPGAGQGGAVLNDSTFTTAARSGKNFLAFSAVDTDGAVGPETITFDFPKASVSIYPCGLGRTLTFTIDAYDANNVLVASESIRTNDYEELSVAWPDGIDHVVIGSPDAGANPYVLDDLYATAPTTMAQLQNIVRRIISASFR